MPLEFQRKRSKKQSIIFNVKLFMSKFINAFKMHFRPLN